MVSTAMAEVLVACVGNSLVADDAAGFAVYESLLAQPLPPGTRVCWLGCGAIGLLERLAGERLLIVVDAVQTGAPPGTVHLMRWEGLPPSSGHAVSAHGIGLREALLMGRLICPEAIPAEVLFVGVEGRSFDQLGQAMTPEVAAAIPRATHAALAALRAAAAPDSEDSYPHVEDNS